MGQRGRQVRATGMADRDVRWRLSQRVIPPVFALTLGLGVALLGLNWRASGEAIHPPPSTYSWQLSDYPELMPEPVTLRSRTGITLMGRFFPGRNRATIILTHGYGGNQDELLPVVAFLHEAGFSAFTYNSRGCGESGGTVTFGALEQHDLLSAVDYIATRQDVDAGRIAAFGFSMGAATTILAAAEDTRIKAVLDDSGWADAYSWFRPQRWSSVLHPTDRFSPLSLKLVELRTGADFATLRPMDVIARISPRPLLIIHGMADSVILPSDSDRNFAAAGEPKELWQVHDFVHGETLQRDTTAYAARVVAFFRQALAS